MRKERKDAGISIFEILVCVAIIGVLAVLLNATYRGVLEKSGGVGCLANLRLIGGAIAKYSSEHGGLMPPFRRHFSTDGKDSKIWVERGEWLEAYTEGERIEYKRRISRCPKDTVAKKPAWSEYYSYTSNYHVLQEKMPDGKPRHTAKSPVYLSDCGNYIAMVDGNEKLPYDAQNGPGAFGYQAGNPIEKIGHRHSGGVNVLFANGAVSWMKREDLWKSELLVPPAALNK